MALGFGQTAGLGALSFLGNQASSAINSRRGWKYAQRAMALQDEYNRNFVKDYYSLNRQSLEKADYNPLLALGGSGAQGASYSPSMMNADSDAGDQAVQSALTAMRVRNENKLAKSQVKVNESQADLNTQQTYKTYADEINARANSAVATATEQKILNDIYWDNQTNIELLKRIKAETKFTNERARGFSASSSSTYGGSLGALSVKGSYNQSKSNSKSW